MNKKTLGDIAPEQELHRAIRVNHAGEYGARMIYAGQLAVFRRKKFSPQNAETTALIEHMKAQEEEHFRYFDQAIIANKVRPTIMQPLWHCFGFALGAATALMGKKAAMACTVAVEEVIDEHYQKQLEQLPEHSDLKEKVAQFRAEELEHRDTALENEAQQAKFYHHLHFLISKASKMAIFISSRI